MEFRCGNESSPVSYLPFFPCLLQGLQNQPPLNTGACFYHQEPFADAVSNFIVQGEACTCPVGWRHDYVGYAHLPNCSLPAQFLLYFFIVCTVLFVGGATIDGRDIYGQDFKSQRIRTIRLLQFACSVSSWLHILAVYLQDGFFEGAIVTFLFQIVTGFTAMTMMITVLIVPIARKAQMVDLGERVAWLAKFSCALHSVVFGTILLAALGFCRDTNPAKYNVIIMLATYVNCLSCLLYGGVNLYFAYKLKLVIHPMIARPPANVIELSTQQPLYDFAKLERELRISVLVDAVLVVFAIGLLTVNLLWNAFGSFPFLWIFWCFLNALVMLQLYLPLLRNNRGSGSSSLYESTQRQVAMQENESPSSKEVTVNEPTTITASSSSSLSPTNSRQKIKNVGNKKTHLSTNRSVMAAKRLMMMSRISEKPDEEEEDQEDAK